MIRSIGLAAALVSAAAGSRPQVLSLAGHVDTVHDPAIIRQGSTYYVFSTNGRPGNLIPIRCWDLLHWRLCGHVFDKLPDWAVKEIPRARAPWAPDISFYRGLYPLYYAVSTFGSNESVIGLATHKTLDSQSPDYKWIDEGLVVHSHKEDNWNAIDPNFAMDKDGSAWLNWGSFWSGIKMRRIDPATGKFSNGDTTMYSLARRPRPNGCGGAIEAPFLFRHGGYWYLFVSFDQCCRGGQQHLPCDGRALPQNHRALCRSRRQAHEGGRSNARHLLQHGPMARPRPRGQCCMTAPPTTWYFTPTKRPTAPRLCRSPPFNGTTAGLRWELCRSESSDMNLHVQIGSRDRQGGERSSDVVGPSVRGQLRSRAPTACATMEFTPENGRSTRGP
jgi:arabinan endo-1,5-alpha-L-arabinosidase